MWSPIWWRSTIERCLATGGQVAIAVMAATAESSSATFTAVNWPLVGDSVLYAMILCLLKCLVARAYNDPNSASLVDEK